MRMNSKLLLAFGVGFITTAGATLAQSYGRGRNVQFVDGAAISPSSITASGNISTSANVSASTLSVGTTSTSTRSHFLTEATAYTPTDFTTSHAVFGRNPVSGAGSGGVWLSYHTTDNEGIVGSLSPVVAWRPLSFASSEWKFRQNGATLIANITSTGAFNSVAASGNQAFTCTNTGCRLSLGNTGRYLVDDGTNLEFIAPVQATTFEATTASGSSLTGGGASGPLLITSNTPDSATSTTVPAVRIRSSEALNAGDGMFQLLNASNVNLFQVTAGGETQVNGIRLTGNILQGGTSDFVIYGQRAATSTVAGARIGNATQPTVDGGKLASIVYFSGGNWVDAAHFSKEGLLRVNAANAAKPTCNADNRGRIYFLDGTAGVADTAEICGKDAANVYAWKAIATF